MGYAGTGVAAFCGLTTPKRTGKAVKAIKHRVDNPSLDTERRSLGISYVVSPLTSFARLLKQETAEGTPKDRSASSGERP